MKEKIQKFMTKLLFGPSATPIPPKQKENLFFSHKTLATNEIRRIQSSVGDHCGLTCSQWLDHIRNLNHLCWSAKSLF